MRRLFVDVFRVAAYDLDQGLRTRSFAFVTLAYLGLLGLLEHGFVRALAYAEAHVAATLHVVATRKPGALIAEVRRDGRPLSLLEDVVGGRDEAAGLLDHPPLALVGAALPMFLLPALMLFTASATLASEVSTRSIRFLACRTDRLAIGLGKLLGQTLVAAVAAALGIALTLVMGALFMVEVPHVESLVTLLTYTGAALVFALPYAAIGLLCSSLVANPHGARALAGAVGIGTLIAYANVASRAAAHPTSFLLEATLRAFPNDAFSGHFSSDGLVRAAAIGRAFLLTVVLHALAQARLDRRDL